MGQRLEGQSLQWASKGQPRVQIAVRGQKPTVDIQTAEGLHREQGSSEG